MKMIDAYLDMTKKYNATELMNEKFPKDFSEKFVTYAGGEDVDGRPSKFRNYFSVKIPQRFFVKLLKILE